jgi:hypothetical protein
MLAKAKSKKGKALNKAETKVVRDKYNKIKKDNKNIDARQKKQTKTPVANPRMMKRDYEIDTGKAPKDNVRDISQRRARGTSRKAADKGPDPVEVGSRSMTNFLVDQTSGKRPRNYARIKNKLEKKVEDGTASRTESAQLKKMRKIDADAKTKRDRKSAQSLRKQSKADVSLAGQPRKEKVKTADILIGDRSNGINIKTGEVYGRPTPNQMEQFGRHVRSKMRTRGFGRTSPEFKKIMSALNKLKYPAAKKLIEMLKNTYYTSRTMSKGRKK